MRRDPVDLLNKAAARERRDCAVFAFARHGRGVGEPQRWPEPDFAVEMAVFPACREARFGDS